MINDDTPDIPARMNGADLAALVGKPPRTVTGTLSAAGVRGNKRDGYDVRECILVLFDAQDAKLRAIEEETAKDRGRKLKAEADLAEIAKAQKVGTLMLRADASLLWDDGFVQIRQALDEADYLPEADRRRLSTSFMKIKLGA